MADQRQAEQGNEVGRRAELAALRIPRQNVVDDDLEWPGLEQVQANPAERKHEAEDRLPQKRPVVCRTRR